MRLGINPFQQQQGVQGFNKPSGVNSAQKTQPLNQTQQANKPGFKNGQPDPNEQARALGTSAGNGVGNRLNLQG